MKIRPINIIAFSRNKILSFSWHKKGTPHSQYFCIALMKCSGCTTFCNGEVSPDSESGLTSLITSQLIVATKPKSHISK